MRVIFDDVTISRENFSLRLCETFEEGSHIFRGRIGSGKSTLALALARELLPKSGKILYEDISSGPVLLMQFPEYHITGKTVTDEILSWGCLGTEEQFELFDVSLSERDPFSLSRGELKRLMLASVFAKNPDVLILDEPYSSLDSLVKPMLAKLIEKRSGITFIFSHERADLPANSKEYLIENGEVFHE